MSDIISEIKVSVWRGGGDGQFQTYTVPLQKNQMVLDIITWVQRNCAPTLSYRFACRVGMCGSCAMTVNGRPRWTCRTHVAKVVRDGKIEIAPLANLPIIKDLAVDMVPFFEKWVAAHGTFAASKTRANVIENIKSSEPARRAADEAIECINCGVCNAACDTVRWNPEYLGPAALNRAWSLANDVRDGDGPARLVAISAAGGCHNCHTHQSCQEHCPMGLNPTRSIAGLKRLSAQAFVLGKISL